jgi:hypothetical protein
MTFWEGDSALVTLAGFLARHSLQA